MLRNADARAGIMSHFRMNWMKRGLLCAAVAAALLVTSPLSANAADIFVPASRSTLIKSPKPMGEVIVADPAVADIHAHGTHYLSVIGKRVGTTTVRVFDKDRNLMQTYDIRVGHDLVALRQTLKNFMPDELIGVESVGSNIALTGQVSDAQAADKAARIAAEYLSSGSGSTTSSLPADQGPEAPKVLNLLQVTSGQQVMLRVRVGEIQRDALKRLGVDPAAALNSGNFIFQGGLGTASLGAISLGDASLSDYTIPEDQFHGVAAAGWRSGDKAAIGVLKALERDGLFKLLAEPNLVAVSGEQAEFLAGGEIPIPVPQAGGGGSSITIEYKPFGVAVKFRPFVLNETRIRMEVQPEVSELDTANALVIEGFTIPAITTRRAKTTVELAPGESFMIAGLIKDQVRSQVDQLPGMKELPILGALFRSTEFRRNETELVIAVTPYMVDPMKSSNVRLPTDNFTPASQMEMMFYGALGSLTGNVPQMSQTPSVEGPIGFMVD